MTERESTHVGDLATPPPPPDRYHTTVVETSDAPEVDGAARAIYERRVSGPAGEQVVHTEHVSVPSAAARRGVGVTRAKQAIYFVFGVINVLLVIRFVLLLLGADAVSGFVSLIYGLSYPFVLPFQGIFAEPALGTAVFEWAALVGIAIYALVAYGIVRVIELIYAPLRPTVTRTP